MDQECNLKADMITENTTKTGKNKFSLVPIVVSTVLCGILFARFRIADYVTDQGKKGGGGKLS